MHLHLAPPGAFKCDYGASVNQSKCNDSVHRFALAAGRTPGRPLRVGSGGTCLDGTWGQVPVGCSAQSRGPGDWTAHYKTTGDTGKHCVNPMYQLVCEESGTF